MLFYLERVVLLGRIWFYLKHLIHTEKMNKCVYTYVYIYTYILCLSRQLVGASSLTKNILYRIFFSVDTWRSKMLFILRRAICVSILKKTHKPSWNLCQCSFTFQWLTVWTKEVVVSCRMRWFLFPSSPSNKCILPGNNVVFSRTTPAGRPLLTASAATARCSWDLEGAMRCSGGYEARSVDTRVCGCWFINPVNIC